MKLDDRSTLRALIVIAVPLALGCAPASFTPHPTLAESPPALADCGPTPGGGSVFLESQVARPPRLLAPGPIRYPEELRAAGVGGRVRIAYVIDSLGRVVPSSLNVLSASHLGLVDAARATVEDGRWEPGVMGGHPVAVCTVTAVNFRP